MPFIIQPPADPVPAVRTNPTKLAALRQRIQTLMGLIPPGTTLPQIDIFALAVAINAAPLAGLARGDFDGNDLAQLLAELLPPQGV